MENEKPKKDNMGGKRAGAGRKKGSKHKTTIEREKILEIAKDIFAGRTRKFVDAQSVLALGCIKVFVMRSHYEGSGKNRRKVRGKPEVVVNDEEIIGAIDFEYGDGDNPSGDDDYYFVSIVDPNNQAINSALDRTFGKATENNKISLVGIKVDSETDAMVNLAIRTHLNAKKK